MYMRLSLFTLTLSMLLSPALSHATAIDFDELNTPQFTPFSVPIPNSDGLARFTDASFDDTGFGGSLGSPSSEDNELFSPPVVDGIGFLGIVTPPESRIDRIDVGRGGFGNNSADLIGASPTADVFDVSRLANTTVLPENSRETIFDIPNFGVQNGSRTTVIIGNGSFFIDNIEFESGTENDPFLPDGTEIFEGSDDRENNNTFEFGGPFSQNNTTFIDPPATTRFDFGISGPGQFTSVTAPSRNTVNDPNGFDLEFGSQSRPLSSGATVNFPGSGVRSFSISDIDAGLGLNPNNPQAFPAGVTLSNSTVNTTVEMTPQATQTAVPVPSSVGLLGAGLIGLGVAGCRRSMT